MNDFWLCFIPLFVAVDAVGALPLFFRFIENVPPSRIFRLTVQSTATALIVGLVFLLVGNKLLKVLGITVADFMVAGGILLFLFSVGDIVSTADKPARNVPHDDIGPVPIGVPIMVGPAVLTTGILLMSSYGLKLTALALTLNLVFAGITLWFSSTLLKIIGKSGAKIISKIAGLLLAAYAVMMIRKGFFLYLGM